MKTSIACGVFLFFIQGLSYVNAQPSWEEPWCPSGWEPFESYCYDVYASSLFQHSWSEAELLCELSYLGNNPHLASIGSEEEMDFIFGVLQYVAPDDVGYWFGLTKSGNTYTNADGTWTDYFRWGTDQPDLENSCVGIYSPRVNGNGEWYDEDCNSNAHYICKMPMLPPEDPCPDGGEPWGDSCYTVHKTEKQTLADARDMCSAETKNLISIETEDENLYVTGQLPNPDDNCWLGLSKNAETGEWTWDDPGAAYGYNNWLDGYPGEDGECAIANKVGEWWTHPTDECGTLESYVVCKGAKGGSASVTVGYFVITAALLLSKIF